MAAALLTLGVTVASAQPATSPRLRDGNPPVPAPQAYGGGQVALALTVGAGGDVQGVELLRDTRPYTDALIDAIRGWRFAPATTNVGGRLSPAPAPVLVVGVFRAPTLYAAPAAGATPRILGTPAPALPDLQSFVVPAYPPNVAGDGNVVIEIELTRLAAARGYRVVSPRSGFDNAALDAVRAWRFIPPRAAELPDHLFVYAVLGFRTPVSP